MGRNKIHFQWTKQRTKVEHKSDRYSQPALWKRLPVLGSLDQTNPKWNSYWHKYRTFSQKHFRTNLSTDAFQNHAFIQPSDASGSSEKTSFTLWISSRLLVVSANGINGYSALCQQIQLELTTFFTIQQLDILRTLSQYQLVFPHKAVY